MKSIFTFSRFKRPAVILFSALSLLAACKKDKDSHTPPVTEPISVVAAKTGDTIRIKGTNFSTDVSQNKVSFNGVAGTVVSASATEIVVVIPEGATSGNVTVTVYENTVQAGSLTISPLTLYSIKLTQGTSSSSYQLVSFNPSTLAETVIFNLNDIYPGARIQDIVYSPTTNEILGLDYFGGTLIKINVATKQKTTIELSKELNISFDQLAFDNANNLYSIKSEGGLTINAKYTLMKIDPATGASAVVKPWKYAYSLTYLPASNELVGMSGSYRFIKYNLTTQDTSGVSLGDGYNIQYEDLTVDNKSKLYALKSDYASKTSQIVTLDPATFAETVVTTLSTYEGLYDFSYIPQRNEFAGIWNDKSFYRYDLGQKSTSTTALSTDTKVFYGDIITN